MSYEGGLEGFTRRVPKPASLNLGLQIGSRCKLNVARRTTIGVRFGGKLELRSATRDDLKA